MQYVYNIGDAVRFLIDVRDQMVADLNNPEELRKLSSVLGTGGIVLIGVGLALRLTSDPGTPWYLHGLCVLSIAIGISCFPFGALWTHLRARRLDKQ